MFHISLQGEPSLLLHLLADDLADDPHAAVDLLIGTVGEVQTQVRDIPLVLIERVAGADRDPLLYGSALDLNAPEAFRQRHPEKHAALRLCAAAALREILLDAGDHVLRLPLIEQAGLFQMLVQIVVLQVLVQNHLAEHVGMEIHGGFVGEHLVQNLSLLADDPADAHARRDDLGEGAEQAALLTQIPREAVSRFSAEAQITVGIVLQDNDITLTENSRRLFPDLFGIGQSGRVLEIRDQIHKLRLLLPDRGLQLLNIDSVFMKLNGNDFRIVEVEGLQGREIGRVLHEHAVSRIEHHGREQIQRLLRAVGDDDFGTDPR